MTDHIYHLLRAANKNTYVYIVQSMSRIINNPGRVMSFKDIFWVPSKELRRLSLCVLSRTSLNLFFSTSIEVERSEPSVEPGTIIPRGLGIHVFINFEDIYS